MKYVLWITGILSALLMATPKVVAVAYFFLIIPGLILTIIPTIFVYLAGATAVRRFIPVESAVGGASLSLAATLVPGWAVMQPFRAASLNAYQQSCMPDVCPPEPITLSGRVFIDLPDARTESGCNYLCLAALDSELVDSVTLVTGGRDGKKRQEVAFALRSAELNAPVGLFPTESGRLAREFHPLTKSLQGTSVQDAGKALEAHWALRLSGTERLHQAESVTAEDADWVLRIERRRDSGGARLQQVSIHDATGSVRFRKSYRRQPVPAAMFYFGFNVFSGGGSISGASFHIGRQFLTAGRNSLHPESELLTAIGYQAPPTDPACVSVMRTAVERVLADPNAEGPRLDLARRYLGLFCYDSTDADAPLIAQILTDIRIREIDEQLMGTFSKKKPPKTMMQAYAERLVMDHTSPELRRWLAESLAELPAGSFAHPSPVHQIIWNSPDTYPEAGGFLARTADLGAEAALPILEQALNEAVRLRTRNERRPLTEGIRTALVQLGPSGSSLSGRLIELFLQRPSPLLHNSGEADDWRFTLARMGVAIRDLPFFPTQPPAMIEQISKRIEQRLQRYENQVSAESGR